MHALRLQSHLLCLALAAVSTAASASGEPGANPFILVPIVEGDLPDDALLEHYQGERFEAGPFDFEVRSVRVKGLEAPFEAVPRHGMGFDYLVTVPLETEEGRGHIVFETAGGEVIRFTRMFLPPPPPEFEEDVLPWVPLEPPPLILDGAPALEAVRVHPEPGLPAPEPAPRDQGPVLSLNAVQESTE